MQTPPWQQTEVAGLDAARKKGEQISLGPGTAAQAESRRKRGSSARRKGANGEREVIAIFQAVVDEVYEELSVHRGQRVLPPKLERAQLGRFVKKSADVKGIPWLSLEVKRVETASEGAGIEKWWKQTLDATGNQQVPVLLHRKNNAKWKVRTRVPVPVGKGRNVRMTVDIRLEDFKVLFKEWVRSDVGLT